MTFTKYDSQERIELIRNDYIPLLKSFSNKEISIEQFDKRYIKLFKEDNSECKISTFEILGAIFGDLECYEPEPDPQRWPIEIGEQELYKNCQENLEKLKQIVEQHRTL